jgi:hypothetical protein
MCELIHIRALPRNRKPAAACLFRGVDSSRGILPLLMHCSHSSAPLRQIARVNEGPARGRHGSIRQELAAGMKEKPRMCRGFKSLDHLVGAGEQLR